MSTEHRPVSGPFHVFGRKVVTQPNRHPSQVRPVPGQSPLSIYVDAAPLSAVPQARNGEASTFCPDRDRADAPALCSFGLWERSTLTGFYLRGEVLIVVRGLPLSPCHRANKLCVEHESDPGKPVPNVEDTLLFCAVLCVIP